MKHSTVPFHAVQRSKTEVSFPAQVPDDEQFVPDFQSDNCKFFSVADTLVLKLFGLGSFPVECILQRKPEAFGQWYTYILIISGSIGDKIYSRKFQ